MRRHSHINKLHKLPASPPDHPPDQRSADDQHKFAEIAK